LFQLGRFIYTRKPQVCAPDLLISILDRCDRDLVLTILFRVRHWRTCLPNISPLEDGRRISARPTSDEIITRALPPGKVSAVLIGPHENPNHEPEVQPIDPGNVRVPSLELIDVCYGPEAASVTSRGPCLARKQSLKRMSRSPLTREQETQAEPC